MSSSDLYVSLLRPPVLHILRACGFQAARPAAVDTLIDLAARYLILVATKSSEYAWSNHNDPSPDITDVRMALQDVGALRPEVSVMEEQLAFDDDMRGLDAFLAWIRGDVNKEIRRIAGLERTEGDMVDVEVGAEREDFLTALRKKHSKTGEESRFQGTALGKAADNKPVKIDGGNIDTVHAWEARLRQELKPAPSARLSSTHVSPMSSPLSDI